MGWEVTRRIGNCDGVHFLAVIPLGARSPPCRSSKSRFDEDVRREKCGPFPTSVTVHHIIIGKIPVARPADESGKPERDPI
jgi:hypothetical protein